MLVEYDILGFGIQNSAQGIVLLISFHSAFLENFNLKICDLKITDIVLIRSLFFVPAEVKVPRETS